MNDLHDDEELDFTIRPYEEWIRFLFDRQINDSKFKSPFENYQFTTFPERPEVFLGYFSRLCTDLSQIVNTYNLKAIHQGLRAALSYPFDIAYNYLPDDSLPVGPRVNCIMLMKNIFTDVVSQIPAEEQLPEVYYMWWDIICSSFNSYDSISVASVEPEEVNVDELRTAMEKLTETMHDLTQNLEAGKEVGSNVFAESAQLFGKALKIDLPSKTKLANRREDPSAMRFYEMNQSLVDATLAVLKEILEIGDERCASCALHGLGHLVHPQAAAVVQDYINQKRDKLQPAELAWIKQCRDGTVL